MRIPRVRFSVRTVLVGVAIVALLLGCWRLYWLRNTYQKVATFHAAAEKLAMVVQRMVENDGKDERELLTAFGMDVPPEIEAEKARRAAEAKTNQLVAEYHAALKLKYERAASRPWLPIAPDPPPPEPVRSLDP